MIFEGHDINVKVKVDTNQSVASVESFWAEVAGERHLNLYQLALNLFIYINPIYLSTVYEGMLLQMMLHTESFGT